MTTTQPVNTAPFRQAMLRDGLSARELARRSGLGVATIRSILEYGHMHASTPLARVRAVLEELGLTWADLFDDPTPDTPTDVLPPSSRARVLATLLTTSRRGLDLDDLCTVLGTTLDELRSDLDTLTGPFAALGYTLVVGNNNAVRLDRGHNPAANEAADQLTRLRDHRHGLNISAAKALYRAWTGTLSDRGPGNDTRVQLGTLTKCGALEPVPGRGVLAPSANLAYCLEPDTT